jgi:hypothetical protein
MNTPKKWAYGIYFAYMPLLFYGLIGAFLRMGHLVYISQVFLIPDAYMNFVYYVFWATFILNSVVLDDMGYDRPWWAILCFVPALFGPVVDLYSAKNLLDIPLVAAMGILFVSWVLRLRHAGPNINRLMESLSEV